MIYVAIFFSSLFISLIIINRPNIKLNKYIETKDAILNYDELIQHAKDIARNHIISKTKRGLIFYHPV
ncbi:hypothetical protein [Caloramator sp. Dgby_cultured_2]|uniref:hypothetical protein n=1 Tax=Caloramator sp. Dgby_cultured_2 TaxID=3029174 RepID=UPI00237DD815|nr:hypothetical protein [Caloramator sp. Dgby_cultured_2]WDU83662.1 hypothetical protein PWK10_03455 [Caloramator sp. Dgby_cultured_2]